LNKVIFDNDLQTIAKTLGAIENAGKLVVINKSKNSGEELTREFLTDRIKKDLLAQKSDETSKYIKLAMTYGLITSVKLERLADTEDDD